MGNEPFNPIAVALALNAGFVSRVNIGDAAYAKEVLKAAFLHPGYALVDIFQPCVTFNKTNTYRWFKENTYRLDALHDTTDRTAAMQKALEGLPMPLGVFYKNVGMTFEKRLRHESTKPLFSTQHDVAKIQLLFDRY